MLASLSVVVVWLAFGIFGDVGFQASPPFESKEDCLRAVEVAKQRQETIGVSGCYEVQIPVKQSKS